MTKRKRDHSEIEQISLRPPRSIVALFREVARRNGMTYMQLFIKMVSEEAAALGLTLQAENGDATPNA